MSDVPPPLPTVAIAPPSPLGSPDPKAPKTPPDGAIVVGTSAPTLAARRRCRTGT